jgi:hypothetical protein
MSRTARGRRTLPRFAAAHQAAPTDKGRLARNLLNVTIMQAEQTEQPPFDRIGVRGPWQLFNDFHHANKSPFVACCATSIGVHVTTGTAV